MTELTALSIICFAFGAIVGSFLGVCIYRIPMGTYEPTRGGIRELSHPVSILSPARSFCPQCEAQLLWYHNIPIVSWLLLRGRCASCRAAIPLRYPMLELLTGCCAVCCYLRFGLNLSGLLAFVVISALIVITFIDLDYMIIPNIITYPGTVAGLLLGTASSLLPATSLLPLQQPFSQSLSESLLGIVFGAGTLYVVWWLYLVVRKREGLGLGDIKLLAMLGALFGFQCSLATIFVGSVIGSVVGLILIALRRHQYSMHLSFGPYLALAATLYIFNFADLIQYLRGGVGHTVWRMLN
jgi:leader peptidase (prepilin peptidase)/N-methyltransferase